jgi:phosphatidylglycerol lysyltransferase
MRSEQARRALPVLAGLILFGVALEVLRVELRTVSWSELTTAVVGIPSSQLALAIALTCLSYAVLTGYDQVAFAYIGKSLPRANIALTSFLAYAVSNNVGLAMVSGASVRYRFYTRWGVTTEEFSRIVFSYSVTFWLGLFALGGLSLVLTPLPVTRGLPARGLVTATGWLLMLVPVAYVVVTRLRRNPIRLWRLELPMPTSRVAAAQVALSSIDWTLAGAVLYVLLPHNTLSFFAFLGLFLAAILIGIASHVPGGLGVFEGVIVLLLKPYLRSADLLPALVVFRGVYYLVPFSVALTGLVVDDVFQRRRQAVRVGAALGRMTERVTPRVLATFTFLGGLGLLFSGATPASGTRLALLGRLVPLQVIEASHFLSSVAGAGLLLLSQGLARRLDGAYYFASTLLILGVTASMLKGFQYEEAILLLILLAVLWRARPAFDRRAAFFETRFSAAWVAAVIGAIGASVWLGLFAFKHVDYSRDLWWQFELQGDASRFLRGSVGAAVVVLLFGFARLIGYAPHDAPPTPADLEDAARVIAGQPSTFPNLAFLEDKSLLFDDTRSAFIMYAVQGRTWAALGDPVGPEERFAGLVLMFLERCADFGGTPVFYEVTSAHLHLYADFGLTFVKLGEEARVDLTAFTLDDPRAARYRQVLRRLQKDGGTFRIVEPADVPAILPALRAVSDDWLDAKAAGEKGFSLGFFDDAYLSRFAIAVIERDGEIQAFANVWQAGPQVELSLDLMRYRRSAPRDVMEALFVHVMQWGKAQGYQWFAMGMAPLSGFEQSPVAPLWNRIGAFLYDHGKAVYNFQGLRAYKQKFNPVWEPHYLAYPGGLRLPRILADVSALVAGGYRRIFLKSTRSARCASVRIVVPTPHTGSHDDLQQRVPL